MGVTWLSVIFILEDGLLIKLPSEQSRQGGSWSFLLSVLDTEGRENQAENLWYGSGSSLATLHLNKWEWSRLRVTSHHQRTSEDADMKGERWWKHKDTNLKTWESFPDIYLLWLLELPLLKRNIIWGKKSSGHGYILTKGFWQWIELGLTNSEHFLLSFWIGAQTGCTEACAWCLNGLIQINATVKIHIHYTKAIISRKCIKQK